ncbi:hypothetical protein OG357_23045 [Streptomyces sp. NBC_01255]|uniref:hypothetical protein n=1 Tax=Streptomyces sp. NBC_01255 TaxID=2903798 RepID=UPI002E3503DA|nr:hypothetical protein [Streptomyces sp. NBC_01255]
MALSVLCAAVFLGHITRPRRRPRSTPMGYYHSTYFAYGLHIPLDAHPWTETDRIDTALATVKDQCPEVGHLTAGDYDRDRLFLVTKSDEIALGKYGRVMPSTPEQRADWDRQLRTAVDHLGYGHLRDLAEPTWLCIPDLS